jgi:hypothetical protein
MIASDGFFRAKELEAYEGMGSLGVARHDVPHVRELAGLIDLLWQEIEMDGVRVPEISPLDEVGIY